DVDPAIASRLRHRTHSVLGKQPTDLRRGLPEHPKGDAGRGAQVEAELVGMLLVVRLRRPDVEADAAEVDRPDDVGQVGRNERIRGGAIRGAHDCRLQPLRAHIRDPLLEEGGTSGPVRIALKENRAALHRPHQRLLDALVVADKVELCLAPLGEENLAGTGDRNLAPGRLHKGGAFSHYRSRYTAHPWPLAGDGRAAYSARPG